MSPEPSFLPSETPEEDRTQQVIDNAAALFDALTSPNGTGLIESIIGLLRALDRYMSDC